MIVNEENVNGVIIRNIIQDETDYADNDLKNSRLSLCNNCENYNNEICKLCGCVIESKIVYKDSECPINKW